MFKQVLKHYSSFVVVLTGRTPLERLQAAIAHLESYTKKSDVFAVSRRVDWL